MANVLTGVQVDACASECVEACASIIARHIDAGSERDAIVEDETFIFLVTAYITQEWANPFA